MRSVYEFDEYRGFLRACVGPSGTRSGMRVAIADAIGCHSSYLTKVIDGTANLSQEQALALAGYLHLPPDELEYLLLLVQHERAGTRALKNHLASKMEQMKAKRLALKERVPVKKTLGREAQATYYSSWKYAAVHMALTVPSLRTRSAIAEYFGIEDRECGEILGFLESVGLAEASPRGLVPGQSHLHLEGDSPNVSKHHTNWRLRALVSLDHQDPLDLHYSLVLTISRKNAEILRERLVKVIQETVKFVAETSEEEEVLCLGLDLFGLRD